MAMPRPVVSPGLATLFTGLREAKGWNTNQAATIAKGRKIPGLSQNLLWRVETGRIAMPKTSMVRSLAALYGVDYPRLASEVAAIIYGLKEIPWSEHVRQTPSVDLPSNVESADGRQSTSVSTEERLRALEGGLQSILRIAFGVLGQEAAIGVIDVAANPKGVDGTRSDSSRPSEGDHPVRARRTGARR